MGFFSRKNEAPKGDKAYEQGYVSFTADDLKQGAQRNPANDEAYGYLDAAMFTSSHIKEEDKNRGTVDIDDVYPITLEETLEMEKLLDQADAALKDSNDGFYHERSNELRGIVEWSKKRHRTFQWVLLLGVFLTTCYIFYKSGDAGARVDAAKAELAAVEAWEEMDVDTIAYELEALTLGGSDATVYVQYDNAVVYKASRLLNLAQNYNIQLKEQERYLAMADTATTREDRKQYEEWAESAEEEAEAYKEEYEEVKDYDFDDCHEAAIDRHEDRVSATKSSYRFAILWTIFFILLCPLYIFAERPYGYTISRHRTEAKVLGGIKKIGFALAGGLFTTGLFMKGSQEVHVKWSDGSRTVEDDGTWPLRMGIKLGLMVLALIVFCVTSSVLVIYSTITGLKRNYDWDPIIAQVKEKLGIATAAVKTKVQEKIDEKKAEKDA